MGNSDKIYHLQGFLQGISAINSSTNLVCSFEVIELGKIVEFEDMIKKHLEASSVDISEIIEWKNTLNGTMKKWFFYLHDLGEFKPHNDGWCIDKDSVVDNFILMLEEFIGSSKCSLFEVLFEPNYFYELDWNDYILVIEEQAYFLHFGMSD